MSFKTVSGRPFRREVDEVKAGIQDSDGIHHTIRTGLNNIVDDIRNGQEPDLVGVLYSCNNFEAGRRRIIGGARGIYSKARKYAVAAIAFGLATAITGSALAYFAFRSAPKAQAAKPAISAQTEPASPSEPATEQTPYLRNYPCDKAYHIDAIVNDEAYAIPDAKGKEISKYQLVVRRILANEQDFRMDIDKDALDGFLRVINTAETSDKENKTFEYGRGYHPREFVQLAQAAADDNHKITKDSLKKINGKTGYKQITGAE